MMDPEVPIPEWTPRPWTAAPGAYQAGASSDPAPLPPLPVQDPAQLVPEPPEPMKPRPGLSAYKRDKIQALLQERASRRIESMALYEPLPMQQAFHDSMAMERLVRGSNQAGKTLSAGIEVLRAVTGQLPDKFPVKDGVFYVVGKDYVQVATIWKKLARAGAFKIIRDEKTQQWRAFRPWREQDAAREYEAKPAPPLLPPRLLKEVAWIHKKKSCPALCRLHNGWEIHFFSSEGKPPQGSIVDGVWFDEEILDEEWYPEMALRLLSRRGRFFWSATPQAGTDQLFDLHERAEKLKEDGVQDPKLEEFVIRLDANPHVTEEGKRELFAKLTSEEQRLIRIEGEFGITSFRVYPNFSMYTHGVDAFEVPRNWTRYAVVDPGHQTCAVLFAAVPPPVSVDDPLCGDFVYLYDELYIHDCTAMKFGEVLAQRVIGQTFQAFLIDHHAGQVHEVGSGRNVEQQYSEALRKYKVASISTRHGFHWGADDIEAGVEAARGWLYIREDGTTKLRVMRGRLSNFEDEIKHFRKKKVDGKIIDKPNQRGACHLMDTLRYLAMYRPRYVKPPSGKSPLNPAVKAFRDHREQQRRRKNHGEKETINLGPRRRRGS